MQDHYFTRDVPMDEVFSNAEVQAAQPRPGTGRPIIQFFTKEVRDEAKSAARGLYVPRQIEMVKILLPGDKHNIVERRVRPSDQVQYAKQYQAFKKQIEYVPDGTPIESWGMLSRAQIFELKAANIFSVEDIAGLSDEQLPALGLGGRMLRKQAQEMLASAKTGQPSAALVAENEQLHGQVALLKKQLEDLASRFEIAMRKSGKDVESEHNPVTEVRAAAVAATAGQSDVIIPENYESLKLPQLRKIVDQFTSVVPANVSQALELIAEFKATQNVARAA
jgi:hypothetical protein